ncbi:hypothetical protein DWU98_06395 [Dyella monticola]|uniref:Fimbrial-type adhesion domain-containing protein n=1 Tax=Dyella monticola TaxID=1927958 RepID=A0A370X3A7_9GAMM|nr:fimbrial protein [Dyella monticola]RDS82777.1 hypothetical protein DWU98_06395 [Dyella monticola]
MYTQNVTHQAKHFLLVALSLAGSGMAGTALAQSAAVTATGDISSSCSFTSSGVVTLNIGQVPIGVFTRPGAISNASAPDFIVLTCTANPGITMTMTGTPAGNGAPDSVLALAPGSGAATGVGVQVLNDGTGNPTTPLILNAVNTVNPGSCNTGCSVRIPVVARYYAISSAVTTGAGNATATLNFTFN